MKPIPLGRSNDYARVSFHQQCFRFSAATKGCKPKAASAIGNMLACVPHEDESPHDVARVALRILAAVYKDYYAGKANDEIFMEESRSKSYPPVRTAFTKEAYDSFINRLSANVALVSKLEQKETNIRQAIDVFERVLLGSEKEGLIIRSEGYAYAWCL